MPHILRYSGWALVILIAMLSLGPPHLRPHLLPVGQLEHLAAYALVGALLAATYCKPLTIIIISTALPGCAALLEILQIWTPGRDPKFSDFAAGALGTWIGVAIVLFAVGLRIRPRRRSTLIAKPHWSPTHIGRQVPLDARPRSEIAAASTDR